MKSLKKKDAGKEKKCLKVLDFQNVVPVAKGHERETEKLNKNEKQKIIKQAQIIT